MSFDLCLKQLHVVHIKVFLRMQYIRLLLFYSVIFQSCKIHPLFFDGPSFSSPANSSHPAELLVLLVFCIKVCCLVAKQAYLHCSIAL